MKIIFINSPESMAANLREVEMDAQITFIGKNDKGFKTYGVTSCIVFVAYYEGKLLSLYHWSTPASDASLETVAFAVDNVLDYQEHSFSKQKLDLNKITLYAVGGQNSCQRVIDYLRVCSQEKLLPFQLDITFLHLTAEDDYIDLYAPVQPPLLFGVYHTHKEEPFFEPSQMQLWRSTKAHGYH